MNYNLLFSTYLGKQAIRATITSGIRSVFCYCVHPKVATWLPEFTLEKDWFPEWAMTTYADLAAKQPFGPNGRVRLGFAIDGAFVPAEILKNTLVKVRALGAHLITSHVTSVGMFDRKSYSTSKNILIL